MVKCNFERQHFFMTLDTFLHYTCTLFISLLKSKKLFWQNTLCTVLHVPVYV